MHSLKIHVLKLKRKENPNKKKKLFSKEKESKLFSTETIDGEMKKKFYTKKNIKE